jgi:hypothetical protein
MKHLRKFNENLDAKSDYILSVFADLQDRCSQYLSENDEDDRYEIFNDDWGKNVLFVFVNLPKPSYFGKDFYSLIEYQKELLDIYEEVKICIDKVKIEFPNIKYEYETGDNDLDKISNLINYNYMYYFTINFKI